MVDDFDDSRLTNDNVTIQRQLKKKRKKKTGGERDILLPSAVCFISSTFAK